VPVASVTRVAASAVERIIVGEKELSSREGKFKLSRGVGRERGGKKREKAGLLYLIFAA
jgi:hypothetical protein